MPGPFLMDWVELESFKRTLEEMLLPMEDLVEPERQPRPLPQNMAELAAELAAEFQPAILLLLEEEVADLMFLDMQAEPMEPQRQETGHQTPVLLLGSLLSDLVEVEEMQQLREMEELVEMEDSRLLGAAEVGQRQLEHNLELAGLELVVLQ